MTLNWNVVTKHIRPHEQLQNKFLEKVSKLEQHLEHFPEEAVHLQISMERQDQRPQFTAKLTLRLPSNILHAEKSADDPIPAFDQAMKSLFREVDSLKAELRGDHLWGKQARVKRAVAV